MRSSMSRSKNTRSGGSVEKSAWNASRSTASTFTAVRLRVVAVRMWSPRSAISPKQSPGPSRRSGASPCPGALQHLDLAVQDDVEPVAEVALAEDVLAGLEVLAADPARALRA